MSFEEDVEHRVDSAGESEEGKPLDKRTADEATLIRRSSLQQMKVRASKISILYCMSRNEIMCEELIPCYPNND